MAGIRSDSEFLLVRGHRLGQKRRRLRGVWREEIALQSILEATAPESGEAFFRALVKHLALALESRYSFLAEFAGSNRRVRTLAFWAGDDWIENIEYDLRGTPCEEVVLGNLCLHRDNVQQLFPQDTVLVDLKVRSFLGVPLRDAAGRALGHLAVLDVSPIEGDPRGLSIFRVFAERARVELERLRADRALDETCSRYLVDLGAVRRALSSSEKELELLLSVNRAVTRHLARDELFRTVAEAARQLLPMEKLAVFIPEIDQGKISLYAIHASSGATEMTEGDAFPLDKTVMGEVFRTEKPQIVSNPEQIRERFPVSFERLAGEKMTSVCALPLKGANCCLGVLSFLSPDEGAYDGLPLDLMEKLADSVAAALDNCLAYEELARLRDRLAAENVYLQDEIRQGSGFEEIIGSSPAMLEVLGRIEPIAATNSTVLIRGETGTGKELLARALHDRSKRRDRPLVRVNCSAISAGLVESELFGHVKGAFTGALSHREGRFAVADGGTILLDEIGDLPLETQVKLLRVLQEKEFEPVGSSRTQKINVRILASTNRDLEKAVEEGRFRADLYYRLNVVPLTVPPLRERKSDIPLLIHFFLQRYAREIGKKFTGVATETMDSLVNYRWPGNVRELQNVIERSVVLSPGPILALGNDLLPATHSQTGGVLPTPSGKKGLKSLKEAEKEHVLEALKQSKGVIEGPQGAASLLGINPSTLRSRMKKHGIRRPK